MAFSPDRENAMDIRKELALALIFEAARDDSLEQMEAVFAGNPGLQLDTHRPGLTALHMAAERGNRGIADLLLARKASPTACDKSGITPLHLAARHNRLELVELLLANDADVNAQTNDGTTPLHFAAVNGYEPIVELLLSRHADASLCDNSGRSPLSYAEIEGNTVLRDLLENKGGRKQPPENGSSDTNIDTF